MIVLGVVFVLLGWLIAFHLLLVIGIVLLVVGACFELAAHIGPRRQIGGRRWY